MRKLVLGLVGATMLVAAPLAMPSAASAEPRYEIWKCWHARSNTETIPKTQYWACPEGTILVIDTYTGNIVRRINGACANRVWQENRNNTYHEAVRRCTEWEA
jgi:hypothetical protein